MHLLQLSRLWEIYISKGVSLEHGFLLGLYEPLLLEVDVLGFIHFLNDGQFRSGGSQDWFLGHSIYYNTILLIPYLF